MESLLQESVEAGLETRVDYDIIMLALPRWDGPYSSTAYSLAKALSKQTRVFYVDNPFTIKTVVTQRNSDQIRKRKSALLVGKDLFARPDAENFPDLVAVTPKMVIPVNWLSRGTAFNMLSKVNDSLIAGAFEEIFNTYQVKKYIFINSFNPFYGRYLDVSIKPFLHVYQTVDDISESEYLHKHGVWLESEWMKKADFTIVTSSELKRKSHFNTDSVFLLPNAANTRLFQKAYYENLPRPAELAGVEKPVICYTGNICHRLDYDLLVKIARRHEDKILMMVGPFANDNYKTSGLSNLPNVLFTGKKSLDELPSYLKHSTCCIIPFLCNQLTKSIYPLKINEYLSAGKPVISTNFSEDILSFSDVIYDSDNHTSFLDNIDRAIAEDSPEARQRRVARASKNNWEDRARQFTGIVEEFLHHNERRRVRK